LFPPDFLSFKSILCIDILIYKPFGFVLKGFNQKLICLRIKGD
jgi:hypothetical protein